MKPIVQTGVQQLPNHVLSAALALAGVSAVEALHMRSSVPCSCKNARRGCLQMQGIYYHTTGLVAAGITVL